MESIRELMEKDLFAKTNDMHLVEVEQGQAVAQMIMQNRYCNGAGTVQGGALFTLADFACAAAANSYGDRAVSIHADINFIKAVSSGTITAKAVEISRRRTIAVYHVNITDDAGNLLATFCSTMFIKRADSGMKE